MTESAHPATVRVTDVDENGLRMMLPVETYRLTNAHAYLCTVCGVLVVDVKQHEQWHDVTGTGPTVPIWPCVGCGHLLAELDAYCVSCSVGLGP